MAHNAIVWVRRWLIDREPKVRRYGIKRMVRDIFHISGFLVRNRRGRIVAVVLNQRAPLVRGLARGLDLLLRPAHIAINWGQTSGIKQVPGRKTDVKDAAWIAELLAHGLLRSSFVPPAPQRALRDLTRQRTHLVQERATVVNRMQKALEWANLKLSAVVTDVTGVSARAMLEALVASQTDGAALADLAKGRLRTKRAELEHALQGTLRRTTPL